MEGYLVGVDVGTTYTAAALVSGGRAEVVTLGNRSAVVPTVIFLKDDQQILTGDAANRRALSEPGRVAREFKRRLGDTTPLLLGGTPQSPQALMAKMLRWVLDRVSEERGEAPVGSAITHPANWGPYKLDLLQQAIQLAEVPNCMTLSEPEAAAVYYASSERIAPGETVAVYDLGGGTFDAAVLRRTEVGFELLGSPEGIEHLGGIDIDEAIFAHVAQGLGGALEALDPDDPMAVAAVGRLRHECVEAKEALSADTETSVPVILPGVQSEVELTRAELEAMVAPWLDDTVGALRRALRSAEVTPDDIRAVLLVGGSSRIPLVAKVVGDALGRPVAVDAHPKQAVALGAALAAHAISAANRGVDPEAVSLVAPAPTPGVPPPPTPPPASTPTPPPVSDLPPAATEDATEGATEGATVRVPSGEPGSVAEPEPSAPAPSRKRIAIGAGIAAAALLLVIGAVAVTSGGGAEPGEANGATSGETETGDENGGATTVTALPAVAVGESGRGVRIDRIEVQSVTQDDGASFSSVYQAWYRTEGYEPLIADDPDRYHIHFFFDTVAPEDAGAQSPTPGSWVLWDVPSPFDQYRRQDRPEGAWQLCALVADYRHHVELDTLHCADLPDS